MKNVFRFALVAVLASVSVACTTGDYPGDEGDKAGNAGSAGASGAAGTAGSNSLPPGGGSGGSNPVDTCVYKAQCPNEGKACTTAAGGIVKCCGGHYEDPETPVCTGDGQGGSSGSGSTCELGLTCAGNGACVTSSGGIVKCCGGMYRDPTVPACNGQAGSGGSPNTCQVGKVGCGEGTMCTTDTGAQLKCCGGQLRDPDVPACNPNQGGGGSSGSGGSGGGNVTCGFNKSCQGVANGVTCPADGSRCCDGVYVDKMSASCGFNNETGVAGGACRLHAKLMPGVEGEFVQISIYGVGIVTSPVASLQGKFGGAGPVAFVPSTPPVGWDTLGNCNAEIANGQDLDLHCEVPRSKVCGSAKDCNLAFQPYAVKANGEIWFGCNGNASPKGPQPYAIVEADCDDGDGEGNVVYTVNGSQTSAKTMPKYENYDLTSRDCVR